MLCQDVVGSQFQNCDCNLKISNNKNTFFKLVTGERTVFFYFILDKKENFLKSFYFIENIKNSFAHFGEMKKTLHKF